jgi:FkbM family methyltransferase
VLHVARISADRPSLRTLYRELTRGGSSRERAVSVRLRPLGGARIVLRRGTSDAQVVWDVFVGRYHLPAHSLQSSGAPLIVDLGANIGLTMADFAVRHPRAQVVGVELDPANAELCRRNTAPWAERCRLVTAAVWHEDGTVPYSTAPGDEWGSKISRSPSPGTGTARAISMGTLLDEVAGDRAVDYLKMDIEGAEREVLTLATAWASRVRLISVEVHEPYTVQAALDDLAKLGFEAAADRRHWASVQGIRRGH